ncbi:MAG: hypothetical protein C5B55_03595 [Blastocatellia bacterium]|nr:MAG: hypothetical protein C5B55_03595 [Blastocatellia bacterium]
MKRYLFPISIALFLLNATITQQSSAQEITATSTPSVEFISVDELKSKLSANAPVTIIDVRASDGYADSSEKIKGAIHIKVRRLRSRLALPPLKDVPRDREVVTYCACPSEESSIEAAKILLMSGFKNVRALKGGWQSWLRANGPVESKPRGM